MAIITTFDALQKHSKAITKAAREAYNAESAAAKAARKAYYKSSLSEEDKGLIEALVHGIDGNEGFKLTLDVPRYSVYKLDGKLEDYVDHVDGETGEPVYAERNRLFFKSSADEVTNFAGFATDDEVERKFNEDEKFKAWAIGKYHL